MNLHNESLLAAIRRGDLEMVDKWIRSGIDVQSLQSEEKSPLHIAVMRNQSNRMINLLLDAGCDIDAKDGEGKTPVRWACDLGLLPLVGLLLDRGCRIDICDNAGELPQLPTSVLTTRLQSKLVRGSLDSTPRTR